MPTEPPSLQAIVCEDHDGLRRALAVILQRCGFEQIAFAASAREAVTTARAVQPHVVVLDIALTGRAGLRSVGDIRAAVPGCAVMLVCPFPDLRSAALAAGAQDLLDPSDLRPLAQWLSGLRQAAHAGSACDCCAVTSDPSGTAASSGASLVSSASTKPVSVNSQDTASTTDTRATKPPAS